MMNKIRVLLTGASGAIGSEVLKQLHETHNFKITVFDIKPPQSVKFFSDFKPEVEVVFGDISNAEDIKAVCSEKDIAIHLAAVIPPLADDQPPLAHRVNELGTQNLIRSLEQLSPNAFLLYSSSISVYGDRLTNPYITLSDPLTPSEGDEYAKTKIAAEKHIQNSALDWSIFRLCAIMGNHKLSKLMFHQPLNTSLEIATLEDTGRAFVNAIDKRAQLSRKIYNLGGGEESRTTYEDFLKRPFIIAGLGKFHFAPKSFAEKNFHCGFYADGDILENILHFRKDTLESYFQKQKESTSPILKALASIFRWPIKQYLQLQSEPLRAYKKNDTIEIRHYFTNSV